MKIAPDSIKGQSISGYGPGWISIAEERIYKSVIIGSQGERLEWRCESFAALSAEHFEQLAALNYELVIFGSGATIRFPRPEWIKPLILQQTGLETMDTQAACRTYNILAGEGRHVVVALLIESE